MRAPAQRATCSTTYAMASVFAAGPGGSVSGQTDGIDSDGSFEIDSKLGLQVTAKFNEMLSPASTARSTWSARRVAPQTPSGTVSGH